MKFYIIIVRGNKEKIKKLSFSPVNIKCANGVYSFTVNENRVLEVFKLYTNDIISITETSHFAETYNHFLNLSKKEGMINNEKII